MPDKQLQLKDIPLTGKLITAFDPTVVGENFSTLKNMRYVATHVRGIPGMSKINSTALTTYLKTRSGYHYTKVHPATESHVVIQAENAGETASQVLENTTAIPGTGDFSSTVVHTDNASAGVGRFSAAPQGQLAYCNGKESLIWGGDESRCAGFINYDPGGDFSYDYTGQVQNLQTTAANVATIKPAAAAIDANTMLLLHLDNNVTDSSPTTPHTVTNVNVTYDAADYAFGTHSAVFNGTDAKLTIPDNADFDFSGGTWTVDCRLKLTSMSADNPIFYQDVAAGAHLHAEVHTDGAIHFSVKNAAAAEVVDMTSAAGVIVVNTWYHVAYVESGDTYLIFVDGVQVASASTSERPLDYNQIFQIGFNDDETTWLTGKIDEFRVSDSARWTSSFSPPATAYSSSATVGWMYLGSLLPLRGFKYYIGTPNTSAGTMSVDYWTGSGWSAVSTLVDGTSSGGVSLAQTGDVTFDDTKSTAAINEIESKLIYWYRVAISVVDATTTVYHLSVDYSMQQSQDIWDGIFRPALSVQEESATGQFKDVSVAVFEEDYTSANTASFYKIGGFAAPPVALYMGFTERQTGLFFVLTDENTSTVTATISYWNGAEWVALSGLSDGTSESGVTLAKSGTMVWNSPSSDSEFTKIIARGSPLYYYKLTVNATISIDAKIDKIAGIPAQVDIPGYKFPMLAQDRLWLCGRDDQDKNSAVCSGRDTFSIFNGDDSTTIYFGDDTTLTAGTSLYSQYGSSLYDIMLFFKAHETWVITGGSPADWIKFPASKETGCVAPLTLATAHVTSQVVDGTNRHVAFLQASDGIYIFDGRTFKRISDDIENFFDPIASDTMNPSMIDRSVGFYDEVWREYHWLFASGSSTTLNREFVYSVKFGKWYEIVRGTGKELQFGLPVKDTTGNNYDYGFIDTGYMERLENGTTFDGDDMVFTIKFGDILLAGSPDIETSANQVSLTTIAKSTTTNKINLTHYGDTVAIGSVFTLDPTHATQRVLHLTKDMGRKKVVSNSWQLEMTTNNEAIGFEPMSFSIQYKITRAKKNG